MSVEGQPIKPLFLDTTIQIDRLIKSHVPDRMANLDKLLGRYTHLQTCSYSRLEYKRVVLQNLALILKYLRDTGSVWLALEKATRITRGRKGTTLVSILSWLGHAITNDCEVVIGDDRDKDFCLAAETFIRTNIIFLWKRFDASVNGMISDRTECTRATEAPRVTDNGSVSVEIPESKCRNRSCNNVNFLISKTPELNKVCNSLDIVQDRGVVLTAELIEARSEIRKALSGGSTADRLYDYKNCLKIGDVWIHLECSASGINDFATTNYKESSHLCPPLDMKMQCPTSPVEQNPEVS